MNWCIGWIIWREPNITFNNKTLLDNIGKGFNSTNLFELGLEALIFLIKQKDPKFEP